MKIELPAGLEGTLTEEALRLRLALGLFVSEDLTLSQAAAYADIPRDDFLGELEKHDVNLHYEMAEMYEGLDTLRRDFR